MVVRRSFPAQTSKFDCAVSSCRPNILVQDCAYSQPQSQVRKLAEGLATTDGNDEASFGSQSLPSFSKPTATIRVSSNAGIFVTVMPLVLPALQVLSSDVVDNVSAFARHTMCALIEGCIATYWSTPVRSLICRPSAVRQGRRSEDEGHYASRHSACHCTNEGPATAT